MIRKGEQSERHPDPPTLLSSGFDKGLRTLAGLLFHVSADELFQEALLVDAFVPWWSRAQTEQIAKSLLSALG